MNATATETVTSETKPEVPPKAASKQGEKKAATPKKAAAKPTKKAAPPARKTNHALTDKVTGLPKENPHRKGSGDFKRFAKLENGMTVAQALEAGVARSYLKYMADREIFKVG